MVIIHSLAPEIVLDRKGSFSSDVYSFACIAIEVLTGFPWYSFLENPIYNSDDVSNDE